MSIIKLESSDGDVFDVDVKVASCSNTIKTMLEDLGMAGEEEVIPLQKVNSAILGKVIEWATHHKDDPLPTEEDENKDKPISDWDAEFLKVEKTTLFDLILAANYLDIKALLDITCKTVANMLKGKTPEGIRNTFIMRNEVNPPAAEVENGE